MKQCIGCGKEYEDNTPFCLPCREDSWKAICPPLFQNTDPKRLDPTKLKAVLEWKYGAKGLLLAGPTNRGKSRCAWELLKREYFQGRKIKALNCLEFERTTARPLAARRSCPT